ncbi:MAG: DnaB-like helicase C-terminal domain-containing protein [Nitrososphaerales archaeon]|jgi:replicative DNA helicase
MVDDIEKLMKLEEEMHNYDGDDCVISSMEMQKILSSRPAVVRYKSDIQGLDDITDGFGEGQLIALSGWTKCGKTSFCQTLTYNYASQGIPCFWFTFELSDYEFIEKYGSSLPLFYMPKKLVPYDIPWIEKKIIEARIKHNIKVVFIDHLHFLVNLNTHHNLSTEIGKVIRQLKTMAINHKLVIFILSHTSKPKAGVAPSITDMRDSSFTAQESDVTMIISRKDLDETNPDSYLDTTAKLRIGANRHNGKRGIVKLNYKDGFYRQDWSTI